MRVDIYVEGEEEPLCVTEWETVPDVGEPFRADGVYYKVSHRDWGVTCQGNGDPNWGSLYCVLTLTKS